MLHRSSRIALIGDVEQALEGNAMRRHRPPMNDPSVVAHWRLHPDFVVRARTSQRPRALVRVAFGPSVAPISERDFVAVVCNILGRKGGERPVVWFILIASKESSP